MFSIDGTHAKRRVGEPVSFILGIIFKNKVRDCPESWRYLGFVLASIDHVALLSYMDTM